MNIYEVKKNLGTVSYGDKKWELVSCDISYGAKKFTVIKK